MLSSEQSSLAFLSLYFGFSPSLLTSSMYLLEVLVDLPAYLQFDAQGFLLLFCTNNFINQSRTYLSNAVFSSQDLVLQLGILLFNLSNPLSKSK